MSAEKPILFSDAMVRAILDGRKDVTRRLVTPQPTLVDHRWAWPSHDEPMNYRMRGEKVPASALKAMWGEHIRPAECMARFARWQPGDLLYVREAWGDHADGREVPVYRADEEYGRSSLVGARWRPAIHLPKLWSRLWLRVVSVHAERLQDMTGAEAAREGVKDLDVFAALWDTINGAGSWARNEWVWRIEFKREARK